MATKPTIDGRRYIQLTDNILLEYIYVCDRYTHGDGGNIESDIIGIDENGEFVGTYAKSDVMHSCLMKSKYLNELYFCDSDEVMGYDGNGELVHLSNNKFRDTILPVNVGSTKWVQCLKHNGGYFTKYDDYWTDGALVNGEEDVKISGYAKAEYVVYDIVRVWIQSGYVSGYDGWVLNTFTKDSKNRYINLACKVFMNTDTYKQASEPLWFNDKVYNNYIEWRQPSVAQLSRIGGSDSIIKNEWGGDNHSPYDKSHPCEGTLPYFLTRGDGFGNNPYIGFELFGIGGTYTTDTYGFDCRITTMLTSSMLPNRELNDNIVVKIGEDSDEGDFIKMYGYFVQDNNQKYEPYSLYEWLRDYGNGEFTFVHQVTVTENYVDPNSNEVGSYTHTPLSYIQTWEQLRELDDLNLDPLIYFRPILKYTAYMLNENCGAKVGYVLRIMNHRDGTSIIKTASYNIINPKRYGAHLQSIDMNGVNNLHIYNRIEVVGGVQVNSNVNPVGNNMNNSVVVKKFVTSSFIDRRNIKVSISPVNIADVKDSDKVPNKDFTVSSSIVPADGNVSRIRKKV